MRTCLLLSFLFVGMFGFAQDRCASTEYRQSVAAASPGEAQRMAEAESFLQKFSIASSSTGTARADGGVVRIPVVVHILYNNNTAEVSDAQVQSQIDALNKDFRRRNDDTASTPATFRLLAADVQVEFYLASSDAKGRATTGIVRKYSTVSSWLANDRIKFSAQGGDDAWDSKSYLNIWVGNLAAGAGYATAPGSDASRDGIVVNTAAFGTLNKSGNYSKGRTATHEVGHWLGLRHIWGDQQCGDDGIDDTPRQKGYTLNCPTGFVSTCSNGETGDMYMNYMDYTADACMNLFTVGQKLRMQAAFAKGGGPRESLLTTRGLTAPSAEEPRPVDAVGTSLLYPNPARSELFVTVGVQRVGKHLQLYNANGILLKTIQVKSAQQKLDVSALTPGVYLLRSEGMSAKFIKL